MTPLKTQLLKNPLTTPMTTPMEPIAPLSPNLDASSHYEATRDSTQLHWDFQNLGCFFKKGETKQLVIHMGVS